MTQKIQEVLDRDVRPALNDHNGDVVVVDYIKHVLRIRLTGMIWKYFCQALQEKYVSFDFSNAYVLHGGGWKKMQDQSVSPAEYKQRLKEQFGITKVHNYYGMAECLKEQLRRSHSLTPPLDAIITDHLDDVAANRLNDIAEALSLSKKELFSLLDTIRALKPHPLKNLSNETSTFILPDVIIHHDEAGLQISLNDSWMGNYSISDYYVRMVCYGNRNYDDALIELRDILETSGMHTFAAAAFIGEHSFSKILAAGRPDEKDLAIAADFAAQAAAKLTAATEIPAPIEVTGQSPYRHYFLPLDKDGNKVDMRKIVSKVNDKCTNCGICADVCPMISLRSSGASGRISSLSSGSASS